MVEIFFCLFSALRNIFLSILLFFSLKIMFFDVFMRFFYAINIDNSLSNFLIHSFWWIRICCSWSIPVRSLFFANPLKYITTFPFAACCCLDNPNQKSVFRSWGYNWIMRVRVVYDVYIGANHLAGLDIPFHSKPHTDLVYRRGSMATVTLGLDKHFLSLHFDDCFVSSTRWFDYNSHLMTEIYQLILSLKLLSKQLNSSN